MYRITKLMEQLRVVVCLFVYIYSCMNSDGIWWVEGRFKKAWILEPHCLGSLPALPTSCVTLDKLLSFLVKKLTMLGSRSVLRVWSFLGFGMFA